MEPESSKDSGRTQSTVDMRGAEAVLVVNVGGQQQGERPVDGKLNANGKSLPDTEQISSSSEDSLPYQPSCGRRVGNALLGGIHAAWDLICEHWFILGVGVAIGIAAAVPNLGKTGGYIRAEYTIKYAAVIVIFLLSGMSLKSRVLAQAATRLPLHILIQVLSLGLTPAIGYGIACAMRKAPWINQDLVSGFIICTSMPTTISTNVVFTKQAGGNEAVSLINSVVGNVAGIFVTPALLQGYLGSSGQAPYSDVLKDLGITVIAPLVVGQIIQFVLPKVVTWLQKHVNFGKVSNVMILLLVFHSFSNTFDNKASVDGRSLALIIIMDIILYDVFTILTVALSQSLTLTRPTQWLFRVNRSDSVAVTFCAATKTLALGMPLITVLFAGQSNAGLLALPLIVYHAGQILQGNLMIKPFKRWVDADPTLKPQAAAPPPGAAEQQPDTKGSSSATQQGQASQEAGHADVEAPGQQGTQHVRQQ